MKPKKLYLIERTDNHAWYDEFQAFVVRAESPKEAREIVSRKSGDEGPGIWLDKNKSSCVRLLDRGKTGIILSDYHAG